MENQEVKTKYRKEKEARDMAVYNDYMELMALPEAAQTAVYGILMDRYGIHAAATIWQIRKRVEKKLGNS